MKFQPIRAVRALAILILAVAQMGGRGLADIEWPDTPVSEVAQRFFEAYNANDAEAMLAFTSRFKPDEGETEEDAERTARALAGAFSQVGELTPTGIGEQTPHRIAVLAGSAKVPMALECVFEIEGEAPPYVLKTVGIRPATARPATTDPQWDSRAWESLDELLERACEATGAPAIAAVVMEDGEIIHRAVAGARVAGGDDAAKIDDRFHIGSITKSMTAVVVARLIERGDLAWDDTLEERLPGFEMRDAYRDVTIEELLQHRSGLPAMTSMNEEQAAKLSAITGSPTEIREQFIRELLFEEPIAEPKGVSTYSNAGYALAGYIAERITGQMWEQLVEESVFEPLGFEHGGFGWPATSDSDAQPRGHQFAGERYTPMPFGSYELGAHIDPAGDVHCSVSELAAYGDAHLRGMLGEDTFLSAASITRLHKPLRADLDGAPYACGWVIRGKGHDQIHWHNGSAGTFFAQLEIEPARRRVIAVVTNVGIAGQDIANRIIAAVRGKSDEREESK